MIWSLGSPVRVGYSFFAAISGINHGSRLFGRVVAVQADKFPCAILRLKGEQLNGICICGGDLDEAAIERRFPGAAAEMKSAVREITRLEN